MKFVKISIVALSMGLFLASCGGGESAAPAVDSTATPAVETPVAPPAETPAPAVGDSTGAATTTPATTAPATEAPAATPAPASH
jgi:hypothetical protein